MDIIKKVSDGLADPLTTFKLFERFIAVFCISIPFLLWLADAPADHTFRGSISNYVYMQKSYFFGLLLTMAAMLFIFNGAVYYKTEEYLNISWHGQWYNVLLGLSLIGVICFPHKEHQVVHYIFAGIFFIGNALVTGIFYKDKDKGKSITLAILTVLTLPLALFHIISLLAAEWISLTVISIHFILSTIDMREPVNYAKAK